jgi:hypothetical protein
MFSVSVVTGPLCLKPGLVVDFHAREWHESRAVWFLFPIPQPPPLADGSFDTSRKETVNPSNW